MNTSAVTYYVKPISSTRITKLGGPWGEESEQTIIHEIHNNLNRYYVSGGGRSAYIEIEYNGPGAPFLKTIPDGTRIDNLLYLPRHYS